MNRNSFYSGRHEEPWINSVDSLILIYQFLLSTLIVAGNISLELKWRLLSCHFIFSLCLVAVLWLFRNSTGLIFGFLRQVYPLVIIIYFYREMGYLIHLFFDWTLDEWLVSVDYELGRIGTSIWNFQQFYTPNQLINEFFSVGYSFYFILLPLSTLVIYLKAPKPVFRSFMFSLCFTYFFHYFLFVFFPAESPRFFMPGLRDSLKGYWVSDWLQMTMENNAFPGGSFPSSHIAASIICFMAFPYLKKWRYFVFFMIFALFIGTIYGRYHYFVDVVAGLGVGLCCYFVGPWLERKWPFVTTDQGIVFSRRYESLGK